ncbi:MAG: DUF6167 family protein [Streptosporangiaceae bacterium]
MRRLFYLGAGAALGVYAMRRASRAAHALTPEGIAQNVTERTRSFIDDVRIAAGEREAELRAALAANAPPNNNATVDQIEDPY